jgi:hypothetical protein
MGDEPSTVPSVYGHLTEADDDRIRGVIGSLWATDNQQREAR